MKYVLTLSGLLFLTSCGEVKQDYCHTQNPASDVELKDRFCDRANDGGKVGFTGNVLSGRDSDRPSSVPPEVDKPSQPDQPDTPDNPDTPTDPEGPNNPPGNPDDPKGNNGHGNGNDDGTCQGRGCTDDTNPGKGPKNK